MVLPAKDFIDQAEPKVTDLYLWHFIQRLWKLHQNLTKYSIYREVTIRLDTHNVLVVLSKSPVLLYDLYFMYSNGTTWL